MKILVGLLGVFAATLAAQTAETIPFRAVMLPSNEVSGNQHRCVRRCDHMAARGAGCAGEGDLCLHGLQRDAHDSGRNKRSLGCTSTAELQGQRTRAHRFRDSGS